MGTSGRVAHCTAPSSMFRQSTCTGVTVPVGVGVSVKDLDLDLGMI